MKRFTLLRELYAAFVRTRALGHLFRRLVVFESLRGAPISRELPLQLSRQLVAAAHEEADALLPRLESHADGLTDAQAAAVRARVGANEIEQEKPLPWWLHLWHCYKTPFDLLLTLLAAISWLTEDLKATVVIASMVVLSVCIRFWQERKSSRAAEKLKAMVTNTATVLRRDPAQDLIEQARVYFDVQLHPKAARRLELPIRQLVPGDVVVLSAGDMIPADCRLLAAKDLFVAQAAMTG